MSLGTKSHISGPRNEMDSVPCLAEFTLRVCNASFQRKLYGCETSTNTSFKMDGERPWKTLWISIVRICTFLWCIDAELSSSNSFWNVEDLSLHVILIALWCTRFILLSSLRLWKTHISGQYPYWDSSKVFIMFLLCFKSMNAAIQASA